MNIDDKAWFAELNIAVETRCRPDLDDIDAANIVTCIESLLAENERLKVRHSDAWVEIDKLRTQLAAAQEEIESTRTYFTTLLEEQRVLLAKAEQRVAEWQPIDTAPNGEAVLLARIDGDCLYWATDAKKSRIGFWSTLNGRSVNEPTHWMPLPKAPNNSCS